VGIDEKLDVSDFLRSVENFNKSLEKMLSIEAAHLKSIDDAGADLNFDYQFARAGMIKIFEMTIESSWKIMQRWIKINNDDKIHEKPKRELFRIARQCGLITDQVAWWGFYEGRNKTAHMYHEEIAEDVYALSKKFKDHLNIFAERLKNRI